MDFNAPLGMKPPPRRRRLAPLVGAVIGALILGGTGVYLLEADPRGGEPFAVAVIPPPPPAASPIAADPTPTGSIGTTRPPAETAPADSMRIENGVRVYSPALPDRAAPRGTGPLVIDVTKALDGAARRTAPPMSEDTRTAATEDRPRTTATPHATIAPPKPRVAIFVSGMGLNPSATRTAIDTMPPAVSFAFLPYGSSLRASVDAARSKGHEVLLQLPMQNTEGAAPGPHTLRADESPSDMSADLSWLMGRFEGYVGVTNLLGAPVTGNRTAVTAILRTIGQRGLFYLDDGTSRRSLAPSLAAGINVPAVQADVVLDATADPSVVRANLDRLAAIARTKGTAIGMASGFPDHLPAIARFAAELDAQGLTLVPVSAIVGGGASFATTR